MPEKSEPAVPALRPFRLYLQEVDSRGLSYKVVTWPSGPAALNDLMAKGAVVTEAELGRKSRELRLGLADDHLRDVVEALNLMRVTVHPKDAFPPELEPYEEVFKNVERCVNELRRDLPKVIEAHLKFDSERAAASAAYFKAGLDVMNVYLHERWSAFGGRPPSRRREPWHGDAVYLQVVAQQSAGQAASELRSAGFPHRKVHCMGF
jgi:hypothetical protein